MWKIEHLESTSETNNSWTDTAGMVKFLSNQPTGKLWIDAIPKVVARQSTKTITESGPYVSDWVKAIAQTAQFEDQIEEIGWLEAGKETHRIVNGRTFLAQGSECHTPRFRVETWRTLYSAMLDGKQVFIELDGKRSKVSLASYMVPLVIGCLRVKEVPKSEDDLASVLAYGLFLLGMRDDDRPIKGLSVVSTAVLESSAGRVIECIYGDLDETSKSSQAIS